MQIVISMFLFMACSSEIDTKPAAEVNNVPTEEVANVQKPVEIIKGKNEPNTNANAWVLSDSSTVEFIGAKVTSEHRGGFKNVTGGAQIDEAGKFTAVKLEIDMTSLYADPFPGSSKFEKHLKNEDFFSVEQFPTASFNSTSIAGNTITGVFEMRGVKKEIKFDATFTEADPYGLKTEFKINRKLWGVVYKGKPDNLIKDDVAIIANLTFASK